MTRPTPQERAAAGDALATVVYRLLTEGEEGGWVAGVPPDTATRLNAALEEFCVDDD